MADETPFLVVQTTLPDENAAKDLLHHILERRLAGCGHMHKIASAYWWEERLHHEEEWVVSFKTTEAAYLILETAISERHPYDVPAIVAIPVAAVSVPYADWLRAEVKA